MKVIQSNFTKVIYDGLEMQVYKTAQFKNYVAHLCYNPHEPHSEYNPMWIRDDDEYLTVLA